MLFLFDVHPDTSQLELIIDPPENEFYFFTTQKFLLIFQIHLNYFIASNLIEKTKSN